MSINHERERFGPSRKDKLYSVLPLVRDLNDMVKNNGNLDQKTYLEKYLGYVRKNHATFRPEYPVIIAGQYGMYNLVEKIADPILELLNEQKGRVTNERERQNFSLVISAVEKEKVKAKNNLT